MDFFEHADKLHEECGIFGMVAEEHETGVAFETYNALMALQHRGQHSAGIAVSDGAEIRYKKGDGLVAEVFDDKALGRLRGYLAIGHVRYATHGGTSGVNAHPVVVKHRGKYFALAFNGNLTNADFLREEYESRGAVFQTTGDAEVMLHIIVREHISTGSIEQALLRTMTRLEGAYSLLLMTEDRIYAVRDPHGFRPLCIGRTGRNTVFTSESCALDAVGAIFVRDVKPGEICVAELGTMRSIMSGISAIESLCVFEYIYFARTDSVIDGISVELARQEAGRCLAREDNIEADVVIGVPDSGLSAALGYSLESGLPYANGLVKNRYIGRTFIQETQLQRERAVKLKLNAMSAVVSGKRVVMVDDSIVRGTTSGRTISILREAGAKEVHMRVSSPPFLYPCYFGTDVPDRSMLIAVNHSVEKIASMIGVDSLKYLSIDSLNAMTRGIKCGFCDGCFTGNYSVEVPGQPCFGGCEAL